jgi:hypothetical protein
VTVKDKWGIPWLSDVFQMAGDGNCSIVLRLMLLADIHNKNVFQRQFKTLMWSKILMRISGTKNDVTIRRDTKVVKAPSSKISDDANPIHSYIIPTSQSNSWNSCLLSGR